MKYECVYKIYLIKVLGFAHQNAHVSFEIMRQIVSDRNRVLIQQQ